MHVDGRNEQQHDWPLTSRSVVETVLPTSKRSRWSVWRLICRATGKQTGPPGAPPPPSTTRRRRQVDRLRPRYRLRCDRQSTAGRYPSTLAPTVVSHAESGSIMRRGDATRRDTDQFSGFATTSSDDDAGGGGGWRREGSKEEAGNRTAWVRVVDSYIHVRCSSPMSAHVFPVINSFVMTPVRYKRLSRCSLP